VTLWLQDLWLILQEVQEFLSHGQGVHGIYAVGPRKPKDPFTSHDNQRRDFWNTFHVMYVIKHF